MEEGKVLFNQIINSPIGDVRFQQSKMVVVANAYMTMCERGLLKVPQNKDLLSFCKDINSYFDKNDLTKIRTLFKSFDVSEIKELVLFSLTAEITGIKDFSETSNSSLYGVVRELLGVDGAGHVVVDLGSGNGAILANFLLDAQKNNYILKDLIGYEINPEQVKLSQMVLDIISNGDPIPQVKACNALEIDNLLYTRAYCFPPFGAKQMLRDKTRQSRVFKGVELSNRNSSEWLFVDCLLSGLADYSKAVAVVSGRALFNYADEQYRKALVESGFLEGIIELPNGSLNFTGLKPYLLIFSRGNSKTKIIDASDAVDAKAKRNNKVEISVDKIMSVYNNPNSPAKSSSELKDVMNLVPSNVLLEYSKPNNGVPLSGLAEVFTGNQYTLGVFEKNKMLSEKPTGYKILTSGDIENGMINWNKLHSIVYNDDKFDKYAVKVNDVIVTSKSSKVKTAVVDKEPKEKILVTGGMIIVRPDIKLLDPTFLKIYLDSEQGQMALKSIQKGSVIITINSKDLSNVLIPVIDVDKQREKADKYNEKLSTLYALKMEAQKLEDDLKNFYLDESEAE